MKDKMLTYPAGTCINSNLELIRKDFIQCTIVFMSKIKGLRFKSKLLFLLSKIRKLGIKMQKRHQPQHFYLDDFLYFLTGHT
jgi:hypothetical protein